jgi:hypothetical protein
MGNSGETKSNIRGARQAGVSEDRSGEATSKKTLSDIEESEKDSGSATDDHASAPAPDGQFDEGGEIKNAGPM